MSEKRTLSFEGASDDLFYLAISGEAKEEYGCYDQKCVILIESPDGNKINVIGEYGKNGSWEIGLSLVEDNTESDAEYAKMPDWAFKLGWNKKYSPVLEIEVPVGSKLIRVDDVPSDEAQKIVEIE